MALATYAELRSTVADWLNRDDLATQIPDFIALAEAQIRRNVRARSVRSAITLDAEVITPAGQYQDHAELLAFGELRSLKLTGSTGATRGPIQIVTPEVLAEKQRVYTTAGIPRYAMSVDSQLVLSPAPDRTYSGEVVFYELLLPLVSSGSNTTLSEAPDIYLYGSLLEAASYLEHDDRVAEWQRRFDKAVADLNRAREREEYGASLRPVRLPVVF